MKGLAGLLKEIGIMNVVFYLFVLLLVNNNNDNNNNNTVFI